MKTILTLLKLGLVSAWLAAALSCGLQNQSGVNSPNSSNSTTNRANETVEVKPEPSATPFTFDVDKLLAYTNINQSESEKLIKGKEIEITGYTMYPPGGSGMQNAKFYSKLGEVWCSGYMETDELSKAINAYIDSKFTTRMPILTAKGIYKSAVLEKGKVTIFLEKCEVIKVTR